MVTRRGTYGSCRACGRRYQLRPDGAMRTHDREGLLCRGSGDLSAEQAVARAAAGWAVPPLRADPYGREGLR
jgi:hypothetical protein